MSQGRERGVFRKVVCGVMVCVLTVSSLGQFSGAYAAPAASRVSVEELTGEAEPGEGVSLQSSGPAIAAASMSATGFSSGILSGPQSAANTIHFDQTSGAGVLSLPLFTPAARLGMKPALTLNYSPRSGNGIFGMGWSVGFGSIERSSKNGVPLYDETDTFIASVDGMSMELEKIAEGRYRAKIEGAFYNFQYDGERWLMRNGKGLSYYFGEDHLYNDRSRLQNSEGKAFQWRLSRVEDSIGNYYLIRYMEDDSFELYWTGKPGTARDGVNADAQNFFARVVARMEDVDRDDPVVSYHAGFKQEVSRRVKAVEMYAAGQLQRVYSFGYAQSQRSGRSILMSIREIGSDGQSSMPDIRFEYSQEKVEYGLNGTLGDPVKGDNLWVFRKNREGYDRGHENYGPVPPWHFYPLTDEFVGLSWNGAGSWSQDARGRFKLDGAKDNGFYFYTYFYVQEPKTVSAQFTKREWNPGFWLNGNYSQTVSESQWPLKAGYNLFEYTDYHQHSSFYSELLTDIASQVDLMNSSQVLLPQLAGDFNGDGFADVATYFSSTGKVKIALSNGSAFLAKETWLDGAPINSQPVLGDFNLDGRIDMAFFEKSSGNWIVHISNGSAFEKASQWISGFGQNETPTSGDFNGDGLTDIGIFYEESGRKKARIALSRGNRFELNSVQPDLGAAGTELFTADFNGDGLTDIGSFEASIGRWITYLNTGKAQPEFIQTAELLNFAVGKRLSVTDVNGDGLVDIGFFDAEAGELHFRCSRATGFDAQENEPGFSFHLRGSSVQMQSADFNGDGLVDFIAYNPLGNAEFAYSSGIPGDLLVGIDNSIGGKTTISYAPSTAYSNIYLPFVIPLVSSVEVSNSRDYAFRTNYWYEGGWWKPEEREFYGFNKIRAIDPAGRFTDTVFIQDDIYLRGKPASVTSYQPDGRRVSETLLTWEVSLLFSNAKIAARFPCLTFEIQRTYDEDGVEGIELSTWNLYHVNTQYGVANQFYQNFRGAKDINAHSNDIDNEKYASYKESQVVSNFSDDVWLVNFPRYEHKNGFGYEHRIEYLYDKADDNSAVPSAGILTQKNVMDPWGLVIKFQTFQYEHDGYGNMISLVDPEENRSSVEFDPQYHLFPVKEIDAQGRFSVKHYFGVNGFSLESSDGCQGLAGQLGSVTDLNGIQERYSYDAFGRLGKVIGPDDSFTLPTELYAFQFNSDHAITFHSIRRQSGEAQTIDSAQFSDGLGRSLQVKTQSGKSGQYIVSGQKIFDSLGRVSRALNPWTVTTELSALDDRDETIAYTQYEYDERDRLIREQSQDGTYQSLEYGIVPQRAESVLSVTDANGHKKTYYSDARGRVVRIEEYKGADGRFALYPRQAYVVYATTKYEYDGENRILRVEDALGNVTTMAYDSLGRKESMDDPDMGRWEYGYDKNGNLSWQRDARGRQINFSYDALNRLVNKTDGDEIDVVYTYDRDDLPYSKGRLGLVEYGPMGDGDWADFQYDHLGREIRSQKTIDGQPYQVQRMYDSLGNLTGVIYPDGSAVYYHFNDAGQLDGAASDPQLLGEGFGTNGDLSSIRGFWTRFGKMISSILGVKDAYAQETYREASIISPALGSSISSLPITVTWDPGKNISKYYLYIGSSFKNNDIYSSAVYGGKTTISDISFKGGTLYVRLWSYAVNHGWKYKDYRYQSTALGNVLIPAELTSPAVGSTILSSPVKFSWSAGSGANGYYFFLGTSPGSNDLFGKYFPLKASRAVSVSVPMKGDPVYARLWSSMSGGRWEYRDYTFSTANTQAPVPAKMLSPSPGTLIEQDQVEFKWDAGTGVLQYWLYMGTQKGQYDLFYRNMNMATSLTAPVPKTGQPVYARLWSRTALGWKYYDYQYLTRSPNQRPVITLSGETTLNGQALDLLIIATDEDGDDLKFVRPISGDLPPGCDFSVVSSSAGQIQGRLTWTPAVVQKGNYTLTVEAADREGSAMETLEIQVLAGVPTEEPRIYIADIQYTEIGQVERIAYGNGIVTNYEYDPRNFRLLRISSLDRDEAPIQDLSYSYDAVGNIISILDRVHSSTQEFVYDHLNRLVQARNDATYGTQAYVYDSVGNILEKIGVTYRYAEPGSAVGDLAAGPHAVTSLSNGAVFQYDANGNMIRKEFFGVVSGFEFDAEGRLRRVSRNGEQKVRFAYDGDGGRVKKIVYGALSGGGVSAMAFPELLEGNGGDKELVTHLIGSLYERTNIDHTKHIFAGDQRIASVKNGNIAFVHTDHLGSAHVITDAEGRISEKIEYQPFGSFSRHEQLRAVENGSAYFTGQRLDDETGLYYYKARYYDPDLGRFISADSMVAYPMNPQALNRYSYCHNNPVVLIDPTGHFAFFVPFVVAAIKGAMIGAAVGAGLAAVTGNDIGQGAMMGAIGGAAFGGFSTAFTNIAKFSMMGTTNVSLVGNVATTVNIFGGIVGGAASGAAVAGYVGADPMRGAGYGALSGGVFGGISNMPGTGWAGVGRVGLSALAGGGISELAGGDFWNGAALAGGIAGADFVYRSIVSTQPGAEDIGSTMKTAKHPGASKKDSKGKLLRVLNVDQDRQSNTGYASLPNATGDIFSSHFWCDETGPVMNFLAKFVPGVNGMSYTHDVSGNFLSNPNRFGETMNGIFFNFQTMPFYYGINATGAAINDLPALIGTYDVYGE